MHPELIILVHVQLKLCFICLDFLGFPWIFFKKIFLKLTIIRNVLIINLSALIFEFKILTYFLKLKSVNEII
jgi:hypothetical protein